MINTVNTINIIKARHTHTMVNTAQHFHMEKCLCLACSYKKYDPNDYNVYCGLETFLLAD